MKLQPGQTLLHYRIARVIGEGGMGTVYLATDTKLGREVALKVLPEEMASDPARLERFQREARAVAALNHNHIVTIHAVEQQGSTHFITMELVEGMSLDRMLEPGGLPLTKVFDIGIALADALAAAHHKGVVHRDLKPANVVIGTDGRIKVLDFGLAKLAASDDAETSDEPLATTARTATSAGHDSLTREGTVLGTAPYMSPEQLSGKPVDHRTDIFALGVVLYEMCAGRRPFAGENSAELVSSIMRDTPQPVTEVRQELPRHLGRIVAHCLEKGVTDRYQSALDVRNALRSLRVEVTSGASAVSGVGAVQPPGPVTGPVSQPASAVSAPVSVPPQSHAGGGNKGWVWALAGTAVVIALGAAYFLGRGGSTTASAPAAGGAIPAAVTAEDTDSLAVLPFQDLSPNKDQEYFTDGLSEELMNALGRIPGLRVAGRTSSFSFKGKDVPLKTIGEQLDVANILEGSVRKAGERIRVSVQLVTAADGFQLWSETYDRGLDDIFAVQDDIATSVAKALQVALLGGDDRERPLTANGEAYDRVLQARYVLRTSSPENVERGARILRESLAIDPGFAPAWAELGLAHIKRAEIASAADEKKAAFADARAALEKALSIDPGLAEAQSRMGGIAWQGWDFEGAQRWNERAMASDPTSTVVLANGAYLESIFGRNDVAIDIQRRLVERDPLSVSNYRNLAGYCADEGLLDEAEAAARRGLELEPDHPGLLSNLGDLMAKRGRVEEARELWSRTAEIYGNDPSWKLFFDVYANHYAGRFTERDAAIREYEEAYCDSEPSTCAGFYALSGDRDRTFAWLEKSFEAREPGVPALRRDADMQLALGDDPRWGAFWRKVGLP